MFSILPNTSWPGFRVGQPEEVPGFRISNDGSVPADTAARLCKILLDGQQSLPETLMPMPAATWPVSLGVFDHSSLTSRMQQKGLEQGQMRL